MSLRFASVLALIAACGSKTGLGTDDAAAPIDAGRDAPPLFVDAGTDAGERCMLDTDGDSIPDDVERGSDTDRDGVPDERDTDSDGDGYSDAEEKDTPLLCNAGGCDMDFVPSYVDLDSDDDALPDAEERAAGTDRCSPDTDGDRCLDFVEVHFDCETTTGLTLTCGRSYDVEITVRVPADGPPVRRATLVGEAATDTPRPGDLGVALTITAVRVASGRARVAPPDAFEMIAPGSALVFGVHLDVGFTDGEARPAIERLVLTAEDGARLATHDLVLVVPFCPCIC